MAKSHASAASLRAVLRVLTLLGEPIRVVILQRLSRTPGTAGELASTLPISRPAVVQHLRRLQAAQLVRPQAAGRRRIYRIDVRGLQPLARWLAQYGKSNPH